MLAHPAQCRRRNWIGQVDGEAKTTANLSVDDARKLVDVIPPTTFPSLTGLARLKDNEKEDAALSAVIRAKMAVEWDWTWWVGSCREEGLYDVKRNLKLREVGEDEFTAATSRLPAESEPKWPTADPGCGVYCTIADLRIYEPVIGAAWQHGCGSGGLLAGRSS